MGIGQELLHLAVSVLQFVHDGVDFDAVTSRQQQALFNAWIGTEAGQGFP
jgi:hypothetical protein